MLDRSTLEAWVECPAQGMAVERKLCLTGSAEADAGNSVHEAIAKVTAAIVRGEISKTAEARDLLMDCVRRSRPDVQPAAIEGIAASAWSICQTLLFHENGEPRHPEDIVAHDGGDDAHRGQIAHDFELGEQRIRLTCEVDLLLATASAAELELIDYKTGRAIWSADDISESFQLGCFYPALVLLNFPSAESVRVRVWNTRINRLTGAVVFTRKRFLADALDRIRTALEIRAKWLGKQFAQVETWPTPDKCCICPAASKCPGAVTKGMTPREVVENPVAALQRMLSHESAATAFRAMLTKHVDDHGDITLPDGTCFGRDKPAPARKPSADVYAISVDRIKPMKV